MSTPRLDQVAEARSTLEKAIEAVAQAHQAHYAARRALRKAQREHLADLEEVRRVAGLLRNTYDWMSGGEDPKVEPVVGDPEDGNRVEAFDIWMGGMYPSVRVSGDFEGEGGDQELADAIASAGQHILDLAQEVEDLRVFATGVPDSTLSILQAVAVERRRQVDMEGYTPEHDARDHTEDELAEAAMCYACPPNRHLRRTGDEVDDEPHEWPWLGAWKPVPRDRKRELVKAMALLVAEHERLDRADGGAS